MRRLRPFLILFVVAAVLNMLVAWACIMWSPFTSHTGPSEQPGADGWPTTIVGPNGQPGWWFTASGFGVWESIPSGARGSEKGFIYWRGSRTPAYFRGGWPMWSVQSIVTSHDDRAKWDLPATEIVRRGIQTSWFPAWLHAQEERRLPLVPFWLGFVVNTLVYLSVLIAFRYFWISGLWRFVGGVVFSFFNARTEFYKPPLFSRLRNWASQKWANRI